MVSTRDRLIRVAAELLDDGGPDGVTLRDVGRRAGVSHNAPYKHFADKSALLAAVATKQLWSLQRRLARATSRASDPVDALRAIGATYVRWARAHPNRFELTFGTFGTAGFDDPDLAAAAHATRVEFLRAFVAAAREGYLGGTPPDRAALLVWTTAHGATDLDLTGHLRKDDRAVNPMALVDELIDLLTSRRPP